jgi:hypothetical protein
MIPTRHGGKLADRAQLDRENSAHADVVAAEALRNGDHDLALYLVDCAEEWLPGDPGRWEKRRELIRKAMGAASA